MKIMKNGQLQSKAQLNEQNVWRKKRVKSEF